MRTMKWAGLVYVALALGAQAQTMSILLQSDTTNASPSAPLTVAPDGTLYGTSSAGRNYGTLFKVTRAGSLTTLHTFNNTEGAVPLGGVTVGTDGLLYGTTSQGGSGYGTIYKSTASGTFTNMYSFTNGAEGGKPYGKLLLASDGNFYGTTSTGGSGGCGAIYRMSTDGTVTSMHQFLCTSEGGTPRDGLIQATDGQLYGTTSGNGGNRVGTIFRMDLDGNFTVLHTFSAGEGNSPYGTLTQGADGRFYGTTWQGGSTGNGTVFRMTAAGAMTTLHEFAGSEGKNPAAALILGSDGNFYGTAYHGGDAIYGTVFTMTPEGAVSRLYSFKGSDGQYPSAGLLESPSGTFLGTTFQGGFSNKGTIFSLAYQKPVASPEVSAGGVVPLNGTSGVIQPGAWISIFGKNLASGTVVWKGDFPQELGGTSVTINGKKAYLWFVSPGQINLQAPDDETRGAVPVVVTTAGGSTTATVTLAQASPSFPLLDGKHVAALILRDDGTGAYGDGTYDIAGPTGNSLGYRTVAAKAGDSLVLFGVGFGPVNPAVAAGKAFTGAAATQLPVVLSFGGIPATAAFSGLSSAGLYQLNVVVPGGTAVGDVSISATVGGVQTPSGTVITLR